MNTSPGSPPSEADSSEESLGSIEGFKTDSILRIVPSYPPEPAVSVERVRKRRRQETEDDDQSPQSSDNVSKRDSEVSIEPAQSSPKPSQRANFLQLRSKFVPLHGSLNNLSYAVIHVRPSGIALHGTAWLSVISGRINIHGATLTPLSPPVLFQSPFEPLLISITNRGRTSKRSKIEWPNVAAGTHVDAANHMLLRTSLVKMLSNFRGDDTHVFVTEVEKVYSAPPLCSELPYTHIGPKCTKVQMPNISLFNFLELFYTAEPRTIEFPSCLDGLSQRGERLVVIGAGNSGKSTLARTIVNHIVTTGGDYGSFRSVVYVDVDVGQPDRGIPGVIAAHAVSDPSFARRSACRSVPLCARYFGDVTPRENPSLYTKCVHVVVKAAREHAKRHGTTMIVNTHGWTTGVGQGLLKELLVYVEPTVIVRMVGGSSERTAATAAVAMDELLNWVPKGVRMENVKGRDARVPMNSKLPTAPLERDFTISAYFAFDLVTGRTVRVKTRDVRIIIAGVDLDLRDHIVPPQAIVGKVCGLGRLADGVADDVKIETDMVDIFGYGLVRAVDDMGDWLFLATALKGDVLSQCSILVVAGGVTTPGTMIKACATKHRGMSESQAKNLPFCMVGGVDLGYGVRAQKATQ